MRLQPCHLLAGLVLPWLQPCTALPSTDIHRTDVATRGRTTFEEQEGILHTIFEHEATGAKLDFVSNSGICETTPGVAQHSGYLNVGGKSFLTFSFHSKDLGGVELMTE
jgi:hypothetical protein